MFNPYERVKGGRLAFKGGDLASRSKTIEKKKKKKKRKKKNKIDEIDETQIPIEGEGEGVEGEGEGVEGSASASASAEVVYTIDAAKRMKYDQLFPVEAKKFGYEPKANVKSVEDALDDRVKKKADRYCK